MFKQILTASAFVMAAGAASATPVQWTVAAGGNDHWYELSSGTTQGYTSAGAAATYSYSGMTGYLATITSAAEFTFVRSIIGTTNPWISGTDEAVEGVWVYNSGPEAGQVISYLPWNSGEPNNSGSGEDFIQIYSAYGTYNDMYNTGSYQRFVVEYSSALPPVPVPAAGGLLVAGLAALGGLRRRRKAA